jgi:energy-coupling factor transporter ATP-binding protein EcfA2
MHIISLQAENFMRLKAVVIKPTGRLVHLTGKNAQGKTSAIKAISSAIGGKEESPEVAIRKGSSESRIVLNLGEVIVTRTYRETADGREVSDVTVESGEGARFPRPQAMLDALRGEGAIDPLAFLRMKPKEQFDKAKPFVVGFDFEANERQRKDLYDRRTEVNRFAKEARAAAAVINVPSNTPEALVDEEQLAAELQHANDQNAAIDQAKASLDSLQARRANLLREAEILQTNIDALLKQVEQLRAQATQKIDQARAIQEELAVAPAPRERIDVSEILAKMSAARQTNAWVNKLLERRKYEKHAERYEKESDELTAQIAALTQAKNDAIAKAHLPVDGLGFGDGELLFNGLPFEQASMAEKLRVAIAIAMAMKPKLRVIWIQDASLFDEDSHKIIEEMAERYDYQVWLEEVSKDGKVGFRFEDGAVVAVDGEAVEQPQLELSAAPAEKKPAKSARTWKGPGAPKDAA